MKRSGKTTTVSLSIPRALALPTSREPRVFGASAAFMTTVPRPPDSAIPCFQSMTLTSGLPVADSDAQSLQIVP